MWRRGELRTPPRPRSFVLHLVLLSGISLISLVPSADSAGLHYIRPAHRLLRTLCCSTGFFFLSAARRWRLPCLMTLLLLYPALSRHSVRRGETLNFCNGLKWSKYHSPPPSSSSSHHPPPPHPPAFVTHSSPVITCCLISWCTDKGRGRFHGEGTLAVFRASLNLALCSFHSNYPESFHTFCHRTQGKDLSANCFQMEIKNNHTATLSK